MRSNINIYNEDCMKAMKDFADNAFDLAIVDPPYGLNMAEELHKRGKSCKKNNYKEYPLKKWDSKIPTKEYFYQLKRVSKNQIIWGGNYFTDFLSPSSCWILWDKMNVGFSFADGELAWCSFEKALRIFRYTRGYTGRIHPTQKPVPLYKWVLLRYAKEGDKILDTHLGSGSIAIACWDLCFDLTAYEIDTEYYTAARTRLKNHQSQGQLF